MKAALLKGYNKSSLHLTLEDYPLPDLQEGDVLLKVLTSGVNPLDNMITRGEVRMIQNYHFPMIAGNEIVGRVEKQGKASPGSSSATGFTAECPWLNPDRLLNMRQCRKMPWLGFRII